MGALEKNRDHSQSQSHSVDEGESLYEDFNHEMNEGDKKLQHITVPKNENYKDSLYKISHTQTNESVRKKISALNLKKMEKDSLHHEKPKKHEILWNYNNNLSLWPIKPPSIDVEITSNDFSSSCMQFFLWAPKEIVEKDGEENPYALKIHDEEEKKSINFHVNPVKLIGECYININKLFQDDIRIVK